MSWGTPTPGKSLGHQNDHPPDHSVLRCHDWVGVLVCFLSCPFFCSVCIDSAIAVADFNYICFHNALKFSGPVSFHCKEALES